jgi:hypothetical protein
MEIIIYLIVSIVLSMFVTKQIKESVCSNINRKKFNKNFKNFNVDEKRK